MASPKDLSVGSKPRSRQKRLQLQQPPESGKIDLAAQSSGLDFNNSPDDDEFAIHSGYDAEHALRAMLVPATPTPRAIGQLLTPNEAAHRLRICKKTLLAHVQAGDLRYIDVGLGKVKPRRMFAPADIIDFISRHTRKDSPPCWSTRADILSPRRSPRSDHFSMASSRACASGQRTRVFRANKRRSFARIRDR
jgi:hypothetical protein